jgi:extracellular factor (EF) 3-hydroxypalmitic acid methyl ester biosynthesis protein
MTDATGQFLEERPRGPNIMHDQRLFDAVLGQLECGNFNGGLHFLAGSLVTADAGESARSVLRGHPLHTVLMEDPYTARAFSKPRGYAGDAQLIDMIYDMAPPDETGERGRNIFSVTTGFPVSQSVRERRNLAATVLEREWRAGKRICALACGHLREADGLAGQDLSNITAVDQDPLSLAQLDARLGGGIALVEANVLHYLRRAAREGQRFDFIYTLGLTDYFDDRAMRLLHKLMKDCLAPGGTMLVANFVPDHIAVGWMDAVMDWHLVYRTEAELRGFAAEVGMAAKIWRDPTRSIAFCEMRAAL